MEVTFEAAVLELPWPLLPSRGVVHREDVLVPLLEVVQGSQTLLPDAGILGC